MYIYYLFTTEVQWRHIYDILLPNFYPQYIDLLRAINSEQITKHGKQTVCIVYGVKQ